MLFSTTNSFANISAQGYPIFALFVLIDGTTCQLTKKFMIASFGTNVFVFLLFFLNVLIFLKLTPNMRNLKLKVPNRKLRKNMSAKSRFYQRSTLQQVVCQSNHSGSYREQNCVIFNVSTTTFLLLLTPFVLMFTLRQTLIMQSRLEIYNPEWF